MDIPQAAKNRNLTLFRVLALVAMVSAAGIAYARFASFSNTVFVDAEDLVIATVSRGVLLRQVRAPGRLAPDELRWVAATSNARVEQIVLKPGDPVTADSVVMTLSNPDLEEVMDSLTLELEVLEAEYQALERRLDNDRLTQESMVADIESRYELADFRKKANLELSRDRVVSELTLNEAILEEKALKTRYEIEQRRLQSLASLHQAELAAKRARINQARRTLQLQQKLFDELQVRAEFSGQLQDIPVEQGQQLSKGTIVARVANSEDLKAELRVQESQVKDVAPGQKVIIRAGNNEAMGTVGRVELEVQDGIVLVDVYFDELPPAGARFDLRIDGLILLEKLDDVLLLRRPVFSQENISLPLFVVDPQTQTATRRQIRVGKASTDAIEILDGLREGEQVIVSDTSDYNQQQQFTLR